MNTAVEIVVVIFGVGGFVTGTLALRTLGKLRHSVSLLSRGTSGRETIIEVAEKHMAASEAVRKDILELQRDLVESQRKASTEIASERAEIAETVAAMQRSLSTTLRRVALVRYDAFEDLGGRLSFSLVLMDSVGNGIVLTSITSTTETRLYAKSLTASVAEHPLSPEEEQAVKAALSR